MPQSLAQILVHIVFSTKHREKVLDDAIRHELHAYTGGILAKLGGTLLKAGSVSDHIHLLVPLPRTCSPAELVQEVKTGTSKWLKLRNPHYAEFQWQNGYGAFSISPSHRPRLEAYIAGQAEHHRYVSFQEEYRRLLNGIEENLALSGLWHVERILFIMRRCRLPLPPLAALAPCYPY